MQQSSLVAVPVGPLIIPAILTPTVYQGEPVSFSLLTSTKPPLLSLVIPTYNESRNVRAIVEQLTTLLDRKIPGNYELILVDDDSPDGTWEVASALSKACPQLRVMRRQQERGLSSAVIRGWQVARGEILGVIDGDLQHPPEVLLDMLSAVRNGADLAVASRHVGGGGVSDWSVVRRFLSRGAQFLGLLILPNVVGRVTDPMSGYFMVQRYAIQNHSLNPKGYKILLEVIGRGQVKTIAEVGYVFQERTAGESKVTWRQYVDYLHHLVRLRSRGRVARLRQKFPLKRFLRFGIVGLSGVFVDMAVLYLLHTTLGLNLTRSKILAAEVAIINNFIWNDAWTFSDVVQKQQGWGARLRRFLKFNLVCLSGLVLNVLVLNVIYNIVFGQRYAYLANLIAIALVTLWNFWLNLKLSWRVTKVK
ncbi:sulfonate abc transporter permease [Leptolyngbya sp. Heron Island J]|uniref:glycosyltransferase n=1 Tax=Leptolyngbya sp. Heron Island J TaxID=1385935 RepID=UPI0003B95E55|nr:glycosyltransferase [Leptolyngbya sp. Heron Island J]ESA37468.1 sulfonate abc transporter permease [Leptolyngbya sp. Heron Island J]